MQEELLLLTMDKTKNRPLQSLSKTSNNDKKNQDVAKSVPRGCRRRETSGVSQLPPKIESNRKSNSQRNAKVFDKRPRPRRSGTMEGNPSAGLELPEAVEFDSILAQGSKKKQNLNHLLNFHFEPRGCFTLPQKQGNRLILSTHKHKYNKEQFLQANCQFIVKAGADYKLHMNNPDALVNWDLIEQVNINVIEYPSCPICLYPPTAAKMTRCGHIYCWPCLLHYLSLSDKTWRKCPICFESVDQKDLKSVVPVPHLFFNTSEEITFKLMKKLRGSLNVCPVDESCCEEVLPKVTETGSAALYSKFLIAEIKDVNNIIGRERSQLELQLKEDENSPEKCFVEQALELLIERESSVFNKLELLSNSQLKIQDEKKEFLVYEDEISPVEDLEMSLQKPSKYFFFYQATDGQHIYLHSLNVKMLEDTYGSLENCPKTITGKIVEKESGSMTGELRNRLRYLQHLPIYCPFEVAEIQLVPPIVSLHTLYNFKDQIESRYKKRQKREKEEKRREKKILEEENKKMGRFRCANIKIESQRHFPDFTSEIERASSPTTSGSNTPLSNSLGNDREYPGVSFAKMLSSSKPRVNEEKSVCAKSSYDSQFVPLKMVNVTGSKAKSIFTKKANEVKDSDEEGETEDYVPAPSFNTSFGDAIASALEKAAISNEDNNSNKKGGRKKKKQKQKVLFATSMSFAGN